MREGGKDQGTHGIASSRIRPPSLPKWLEPRVHLLTGPNVPDWKIACVLAPAGFGKTILLAEWAAETGAAWLTLGPDLADPSALVSGITTAFLKVGRPGLEGLPAVNPEAPSATPRALQTALDDAGPWHLVLDDTHQLPEEAAAVAVVAQLVEAAAHGTGQLALAGRSLPGGLGLGRVAATGALIEIGASHLSFGQVELERILERGFGIDPLVGRGMGCAELIQGWPALVVMAGRWLADGHEGEDAWRAFQDRSMLFEFLADEVLPRLDPNHRDLLERCAPLPFLDEDLCRSLGFEQAAPALRHLCSLQLMIQTDDTGGASYAIHPMLRAHLRLRAQVESTQDARAAQLNAAAEALARRREWAAAFELWDEAGNHDAIVARLLEWEWTPGSWWVDAGWLERLPDPTLTRTPLLLYRFASAFAMRNQFELASNCFERAEQSKARAQREAVERTARVVALYYMLRFVEAFPEARGLLGADDLSKRERWLVHSLCLQMSVAQGWQFNEAIEHGHHTVALAEELRSPYLTAIAYSNLGGVLACAGAFDEAIYSIQRARSAGIDAIPYAHALTAVAEACCAWLTEDPEGAHRIREALDICEDQELRFLAPQMRALGVLWDYEHGAPNPGHAVDPEAASYFGPVLPLLCRVYRERALGNDVQARELAMKAAEAVTGTGYWLGCWPQTLAALVATGAPERAAESARLAVQIGRAGGSHLLAFAGHFFGAVAAGGGAAHEDLAESMRLARVHGFDRLLEQRWGAFARPVLNEALARHVEPEFARTLLVRLGCDAPRVCLFGGLRAWIGDREMTDRTWVRPRARAVFAYLVLRHREWVPLDELAEAFWPEQDPAESRPVLNVALTQLRKALEPDLSRGEHSTYLKTGEESLCLDLGPGSWVDVRAFETLARQARNRGFSPETRAAAAVDACALSKEELLPEYRYEAWTAERAEGVRQIRRDMALEIALQSRRGDDWEQVIAWLQPLVDADAMDEQAFRMLAEALARSGRTDAARRAYSRLCNVLQQELGLEPTAETLELARTLGLDRRR